MPRRGRTINVFLMDGEANGRIKLSIGNWNGIAYKIPRRLLLECRDTEAFNYSGIYFLFGNESVYIGQAEVRANGGALYRRIMEHTADKLSGSWDEVVVFTTRDNTLGRTDISFLENYFYEEAVRAKRYCVLNNNTPSPGTVTEEKRCELEEYAEHAELFLGVLGYKVYAEPETLPTSVAESLPRAVLITTPNQKTTSPPRQKPPLPVESLAIGRYVYTAMKNLSEAEFAFSIDEIDAMCKPEWSIEHFHTKNPFMKKYIAGQTDNKGVNGYVRFLSTPYQFGTQQVLISKEWYERQRDFFKAWYNGL